MTTSLPAHAVHAQIAQPKCEPGCAEDTIVITGQRNGYLGTTTASATRTETPNLHLAQSVQIVDRRMLEDQDVRTLGDGLVNISGVTPSRSEENLFVQHIVRGFPAEIYRDGMPAFGSNASTDPTSVIGVDRIEVIKGPTSTIYGGGPGAPLGGIINIVSNRPRDKFIGLVALRAGSFTTVSQQADINVPLTKAINARIAGEYQQNKSWIDFVRGHKWSVQPALSFVLASKTHLLLKGQYDHRSQLEYSGLPAKQALMGKLASDAFPGPHKGQPFSTTDNRQIAAELVHQFSADVRLNVTGQYHIGQIHEYGTFVYPDLGPPDPAKSTVYPIFKLYLPNRIEERTLDINLSANIDALGGHHRLLGGAAYDRTVSDAAVSAAEPLGALDLARPHYDFSFGVTPKLVVRQTSHYETGAAYIQDQATYGPLHLSGSLRYTQLKLHHMEQGVNRTYHRFTPRLGATLDIANGVAVFGGYANGFRAPVNYNGSKPPKPETSSSFEGGLKLALKRARLSGTIAAFQLTRRNVTVADPDDPFSTKQTGEQRAQGLEADLTWEPTAAFSLLANYAYTEATVTRDTVIPVGSWLPRVPRHGGRIAARYRVQRGPFAGLSFGAGISGSSSRQLTLPNSVSVPAHAITDAQAAYDLGWLTIAASAVNIAGRRAFEAYQYLAFPVVIPAQPPSAYLTLKAHF